MFTLNNFYQSKEWCKLVGLLRLERLNDQGQLICWHCGKPIINKYDAIGHHTIFLTNENVNDYEISLNPELIKFVHHKCHNYIHNKLGYIKREVYLIYGSPFSGKTTWVSAVSEPGDLVVDIDNIWQCVSGCNRYIKPQRLNAIVFGMRDYLLDSVRVRRGKWNNAYIIGGYPLISERERLCRSLGAREVYIEATKEQCLERLELSEDRDKIEWTKYIEEWWKRYRPPIV